MATLADVKRAARKIGATVEYGRIGDSVELAVTAPDGMCWEEELHQFVDTSHHPWKPDFADMLSRMSYGAKPCDDPNCEWCHPQEKK